MLPPLPPPPRPQSSGPTPPPPLAAGPGSRSDATAVASLATRPKCVAAAAVCLIRSLPIGVLSYTDLNRRRHSGVNIFGGNVNIYNIIMYVTPPVRGEMAYQCER